MKILAKVDGNSLLDMNAMKSYGHNPITFEVTVDKKPLLMGKDIGAAVSIILLPQFKKLHGNKKLSPTSLKLRTYMGALVMLKGVVNVEVRHNDQVEILPLYVTGRSRLPLFS